MSKVKQYIEQATNERIRSRGLIRKVAIEAARIQREETRRQAIEVYKQMCPSKNCKGCASRIHKQYLQPIITQYFIDNKSEIWLLFLIAHSKR